MLQPTSQPNTPKGSEPEKPSFEKAPEYQTAAETDTQKQKEVQQEKEVKPEIPETQKPSFAEATKGKPEMPTEEAMPKGGPSDQQTQAQTSKQATSKTDEQIKKERAQKIKGQLDIKILENSPQERKISGKLEDWHNDNVLKQNLD